MSLFLADFGEFVGKLHPVLVHFPIALLYAAALAQLIGLIRRNAKLDMTVRFCLWIATLGAIASTITGLINEENRTFFEEVHETVERHETAGLITTGLCIALVIIDLIARKKNSKKLRVTFYVLLFLATVIVSIAGHLGGVIVYGDDYLSW